MALHPELVKPPKPIEPELEPLLVRMEVLQREFDAASAAWNKAHRLKNPVHRTEALTLAWAERERVSDLLQKAKGAYNGRKRSLDNQKLLTEYQESISARAAEQEAARSVEKADPEVGRGRLRALLSGRAK